MQTNTTQYPMTNIHPDAKIGENVVIDAFTTIQKDVEIGEGTWISSNVTIMEGARIGKNCKIYPGAVIAAQPQDLKFEGEKSLVVVGDNTVIRECVTLNRGTSETGQTVVGQNCLIMAYVHVAHDCVIGNNCILVNNVQVAGHVEIDDFAILGGSTNVHQFVKVGTHCIVSGGSLIRKDVPPFTKAGREPLSYCGINTIGLKRRGFDQETINDIQEIYRRFFLQGHNNKKAIELIEEDIEISEHRDEILNFFKKSTRGIMKGY